MRARPPLAIITGPTGSGKSALALKLAEALGGEIINADSLAFYRGFDIGTAKPAAAEQKRVPHHLFDILNPDEDFDAAAYLRLARPLVERLAAQGRPALAVGGTGFYLRSLTQGLFEGPGRDEALRRRLAAERAAGVDLHARLAAVDPTAAARLAPADWPRIERALEVFELSGRPISQWQREHALAEEPFRVFMAALELPALELELRLARRTELIFSQGLVEEVKGLLAAGWSPMLKPFGAIGYKEVLAHLRGELSLEEAKARTLIATRRYAKRQRTWLKGQAPQAFKFHPSDFELALTELRKFFQL